MIKNKVIAVLAACAVLFSALAAFLIWKFMTPQRATIYTFNADYSTGTQITDSMLIPTQVDATMVSAGQSSSVANGFVTNDDYLSVVRSGDSLRMDVTAGMPLTTAMLSVTGGSTIDMNMTTKNVAITVPVNSYSGITDELKNGAKVNVYRTTGDETALIQQKKTVLQVFHDGGSIVAVTLDEGVQESLELVNAMENGSIYLGLVNDEGYASEGSKVKPFAYVTAAEEAAQNASMTSVDLYGTDAYASSLENADGLEGTGTLEAADAEEEETENGETEAEDGGELTP